MSYERLAGWRDGSLGDWDLEFAKSSEEKIKSSSSSRHDAETCNEWRDHLRSLALDNTAPKKRRSGGEPLLTLTLSTSTILASFRPVLRTRSNFIRVRVQPILTSPSSSSSSVF